MSIIKKSVIIVLLVHFTPVQARADVIPELVDYLDTEVFPIEYSLDNAGFSTPGLESEKPESWMFKNLFLRSRSRVSFGLPGLAQISVIPEVEMVWQQVDPDGWVPYNPDAQ